MSKKKFEDGDIFTTGASAEWFTPRLYIEAARLVMGSIDLDPASCAFANETVKATRYYTQEQNGLAHPWSGNVWCNPPYGRTPTMGSNLKLFTHALVQQYEQGSVTQGMMLIPSNTATSWFLPLWRYPICFPTFRIRFNTVEGKSDGSSFGTCFIYLGPHEERFTQVFQQFGPIVRAVTAIDHQFPVSLWDMQEAS